MMEACGVFGAYAKSGAAFPYMYWGLLAQNHRGHQSYGFLTLDRGFHEVKALGLIPQVSGWEVKEWLKRLPGNVGVGHVRYATSGLSDVESLRHGTQPAVFEGRLKLALAYNGNVVWCKRPLERPTHSDVEVMGKVLSEAGELEEGVKACMDEVEGAFSAVGLTSDGTLFAFRDPHGIKPLCHGDDGNVHAFSSESVGLNINSIEYLGEVEPGELIKVSEGDVERVKLRPCRNRALCAFEFAYFARPDSILNGRYVYEARVEFGRNLGREYSEIAERLDVILDIPETASDAAYGLHVETSVPWERALRRHRYVTHRAFISSPKERSEIIDKKINVLSSKIRGRRVGVVDDSIVRGDTTRIIVKKLRAAGAREVHLFITFPRIISPCFYGIDMATYGELIGFRHEPEEIAKLIGADSVNYQPIRDFVKATGMRMDELCLGCVTGRYPTPTAQRMADEARRLLESGWSEEGRIYEAIRLGEKP